MATDARVRAAMEDEWETHAKLIDNGLLDPGQPTRYATLVEQARLRDETREFTPDERRLIRWSIFGFAPEPPLLPDDLTYDEIVEAARQNPGVQHFYGVELDDEDLAPEPQTEGGAGGV